MFKWNVQMVVGTKPEKIRKAVERISKHNRLHVGRIALERLVGALINCSLLQTGEPKWD